MESHPVFQDMLQLGCTNKLKMMLAFQSYIKLCEVEKIADIEVLYNKCLDVIYFSCPISINDHRCYVPVPHQQQMSPAWINSMVRSLQSAHPKSNVFILLETPNSTLLSYKVSCDLQSPMSPDAAKEKKALHEQKQYIQSELYKKKIELLGIAKLKNDKKM